MSTDTPAGDTGSGFVVDRDLTIGNVTALQEALMHHAWQESGAQLDCSAVEEIDSAGLQLLLSLKKHIPGDEVTVRLTHCCDDIRRDLGIYGVRDHFVMVDDDEQA